MNTWRIHTARLITFVVALQILNLGLFAQQISPFNAACTTETNTINSFVEYIAETILEHKDAVPETKNEHHHKDLQAHKHVVVQLISIEREPALTAVQTGLGKTPVAFSHSNYYQFCKEINPPPPKA